MECSPTNAHMGHLRRGDSRIARFESIHYYIRLKTVNLTRSYAFFIIGRPYNAAQPTDSKKFKREPEAIASGIS